MKKFCMIALLLTGYLSSLSAQPLAASPVPYGNNKAVGKYYAIRGFNMYAEVYGEGAPLLIIHGNGGSISNFAGNIPYFSKKYKTIIADSRSQGKSADAGDSLSYEMMADDYAALLSAMHIDSAYVIGWSDGGINGLLLAMRHPEKVKKLAVTGANLQPDTNAVFQEVWDLVYPEYNRLKVKASRTAPEKNQWKLMRLLAEQPHIPAASLHAVLCPTLVIGGDHDVIREDQRWKSFTIYRGLISGYYPIRGIARRLFTVMCLTVPCMISSINPTGTLKAQAGLTDRIKERAAIITALSFRLLFYSSVPSVMYKRL